MCQHNEGPDWLMLMGISISNRLGSIVLAILAALVFLLPAAGVRGH